MTRLLPLLLALLAPLAASAQAKPAKPDAAKPADAAEPAPLSPEVQALVKKEVEKAKAELRDEMRAEVQGQQAAKEFLDIGPAPAEKAKLDFFQVSGYFRLRGDLFDDLSLKRSFDPMGYYLFPPPIGSPDKSTQTSANLRLRLEPVLNVSEQVRVLTQVDVLDGVVMGSTSSGAAAYEAVGQTPPEVGVNGMDRSSIRVKRVWGEVQTPLGLLSFGRMPDQWGLGVSANAGSGLEDDLGDNVDRVQLAIPVRQFLLGSAVLAPYYDINASGLVSQNLGGTGQGFSLDRADARTTLGLKLLWLDAEEEVQRKIAAGKASWNGGFRYGYHTQAWAFGNVQGVPGTPSANPPSVDQVKIGLAYHTFDLWGRLRTKKWRLEAEASFVYGSQQDARLAFSDPALGPVDILQFGGVVQADVKPVDRLVVGLEAGFASGDRSPGFGNQPGRTCATGITACQGLPPGAIPPGSIDGPQVGDNSLKNFRFNPAYRVDLILWRELLGGVTDAWYLKPSFRYDILEGLSLRGALIYSQAVFASSTPSTNHRPLGLELDTGLHYASDDGFHLWVDWGILQPLDGLGYGPNRVDTQHALVRGHALRSGIAIKF